MTLEDNYENIQSTVHDKKQRDEISYRSLLAYS